MGDELGGGTWQFKNAIRISRILSPKQHIPGKSYDDLTGATCTVDDPKIAAAYHDAAQKLARQLWISQSMRCAGSKALNDNGLEGTWYRNSIFVKYDQPKGDSVGDTSALQPDLGGVDDRNPALKLCWSPPDGSERSRTSIPVEVRGEWPDLIAQAATHARSLFSGNPSRVFALVLGVNPKKKNLGFLLFNRGGLTTHTELSLETTDGRADVLRVLMTILSWSEEQHAGVISTSNDPRYMLPVSADLHSKASIAKVIYHSDCVRGRAKRVTRLTCDSVHHSEATVLSSISTTTQATAPRLNPTAQSPPPSLPASQLTGSRGYQNQDSKPKKDPEPVRTLGFTTFRTVGKSLTEAGSSDELCMALVHALLGKSFLFAPAQQLTGFCVGWLSYYQSGFMQRDISIVNVLLAVGETRSKEPFAISGDILKPQRPHSSLDEALGGMETKDAEPENARIASEITVLFAQLEIKDKDTVFVVDGDMAANWMTCFEEERNATKFGTPEFMSLELRAAMDDERPYVHSPVDDIQSFFWLAMWAVLFNTKPQTRSRVELKWQQRVRSGTYRAKASVVSELGTTSFLRGHSLIGTQVFPLLQDWWDKQRALAVEWHTTVVPEAESIPQDETDKIRCFYLHHFHLYALRGVKEFWYRIARS
ncbi:hypothetical protein DFH06DRAFT_1425076 [Mycena polygramma]|nr:hypothetical protein DFH06DRAFT_1425076 [Mycena polygramma]